MTYLTNGGDESTWEKTYPIDAMATALHDAVATTINLQTQMLGPRKSPNSLNLCVTDGRSLVAYRFRNHATQEPPSLYYSTTAGTTLNRKFPDHPDGARVVEHDAHRKLRTAGSHGAHVIVASEPSTYDAAAWTLVPRNCVLRADRRGRVRVDDVPYDPAWDAVDPSNP